MSSHISHEVHDALQQHWPELSEYMQLSLDHGRKWATDKPLRDGMSQIRASMTSELEPIHHER